MTLQLERQNKMAFDSDLIPDAVDEEALQKKKLDEETALKQTFAYKKQQVDEQKKTIAQGIKPPDVGEAFKQFSSDIGQATGLSKAVDPIKQSAEWAIKYMNPLQMPLHNTEEGTLYIPGTVANVAVDAALASAGLGGAYGLGKRVARGIAGDPNAQQNKVAAINAANDAEKFKLEREKFEFEKEKFRAGMGATPNVSAPPPAMAPSAVVPPVAPAPIAPMAQAPVTPPPTLAQTLQSSAAQNLPITQVAQAQINPLPSSKSLDWYLKGLNHLTGPAVGTPSEVSVATQHTPTSVEPAKADVLPPTEPVKTNQQLLDEEIRKQQGGIKTSAQAPSAAVPPPAEKAKPAKKPSGVVVKLLDTPKEWEKLTKEGKTFLPGYGAGDNSLFNTYGAEGRRAILEKFNDGKPLGSDENYKELNKKLRKGVPASEVADLMARLPAASEAGNYGPLGKKALIKAAGVGGLLLTAGELANAAQKAKEGNLAPASETGFNLLGMIPGLGTAFNAATYSKGLGEGEAEALAKKRAIPPPASYRR